MAMSLAPHPASLRQLQYAVAVADARSFRRAAEQCGVSQPSLSAQLAQLEGALGVRLFERDRRRVLLTPAGEDLIERARARAGRRGRSGRRRAPPGRSAGRADQHRRHPDRVALPAAVGRAGDPPRAPAADRALAGGQDREPRARSARGPARRRAAGAGGGPRRHADARGDRPRPVRARHAARAPAGAERAARRSSATCAARTCCCSTTATACAIRRWRCARARAPRSSRSAPRRCRRWRRWCPPAPASRCCRAWRWRPRAGAPTSSCARSPTTTRSAPSPWSGARRHPLGPALRELAATIKKSYKPV